MLTTYFVQKKSKRYLAMVMAFLLMFSIFTVAIPQQEASATDISVNPNDITAAMRYDTSDPANPKPIGEMVTDLHANDDASQLTELPFPINWYGDKINQVCLSTNGAVFPVSDDVEESDCPDDYDYSNADIAYEAEASLISVFGNDSFTQDYYRNFRYRNICQPDSYVAKPSGSRLYEYDDETYTTGHYTDTCTLFTDTDSDSYADDGFANVAEIYLGTTQVDGQDAIVITWYRTSGFSQDNGRGTSNTFQLVLISLGTGDATTGYDFVMEYNYGTLTSVSDGYYPTTCDGYSGYEDCEDIYRTCESPGNCVYGPEESDEFFSWGVGTATPHFDVNGDILQDVDGYPIIDSFELFPNVDRELLADGAAKAITSGKLNSDVLGRYRFFMIAGGVKGFAQPGDILAPASFTDSTVSQGSVGVEYSDGVAADGDSPKYTISEGSLPPGLSIDEWTGAITGTPSRSDSYTFKVKATNDGGFIETVTLTIEIVGSPSEFSDQEVANGVAGSVYSDGVKANGAPAPTYSLANGTTLPPGLSLDATTGAITGTPLFTGEYTFTIKAENSVDSITLELTIVIDAPTPTPTPSPSATATPTPSPSATATPSPSATATPSPSATATPSPSATATPTPSPSATATPTATPEPVPTGTPETVPIDVIGGGDNGEALAQGTITRTTYTDGQKVDDVVFTEQQIDDMIQAALDDNTDFLGISIPDTNDEVKRVNVEIPQNLIQQLVKNKINFQVKTQNGSAYIPYASLEGITDDLFFYFIPVKDETAQQEVADSAKTNIVISTLDGAENLKIIGRPMTIDTNLQNRLVTLFIPFDSTGLTDDEKANIGVYIQHSDGEEVFIRGTVKTINGVEGVEFNTEKFSTFTLVTAAGADEYLDETLPDTGEGFPLAQVFNAILAILAGAFLTIVWMRRRQA